MARTRKRKRKPRAAGGLGDFRYIGTTSVKARVTHEIRTNVTYAGSLADAKPYEINEAVALAMQKLVDRLHTRTGKYYCTGLHLATGCGLIQAVAIMRRDD